MADECDKGEALQEILFRPGALGFGEGGCDAVDFLEELGGIGYLSDLDDQLTVNMKIPDSDALASGD